MRYWKIALILLVSVSLVTIPLANAASLKRVAYRTGTMVRLPGHVLPVLAQATPVAAPFTSGAEELVNLTIVLKRHDQAGFERYLREVYDPQSPRYRKFLTQRELSNRFGPSREAYDDVLGYLQDNGFTLSAGSANRLTLTVRGSRAMVGRTFGVQISDYKMGDKQFFANDANPVLPQYLASNISAIAGMSNMATVLPNTITEDAKLRAEVTRFVIGLIGIFLAISATIAGLGALFSQKFSSNLPNDDITGVYEDPVPIIGANPPASATGAGQKIGVLAFSSFQMSNVADWLALVGKPASLINQVSQVHVNGGAPLGTDENDVLLSIETLLSLAPGAEVVVYDGPSSGPGTSFQTLLNTMIGDGVTIISNSFSYCEDQTTLADVQSIDAILATAAASGISVFNAAGDSGNSCGNGSPNTLAVPASSPNATAVGGSSITVGPGLTYGNESWWDGLSQVPPTGQGGFGESRFFSRPSYQDGLISGPMRSVPDVVASADPRLGFAVCQASAGGCPTGSRHGGTSMAVAIWAAFTALLNEAQGHQLGFLNPLLYPLAGTGSFHSASRMGSDAAHVGLGSPNVNLLSLALAGLTPGPVDPSTSLVEAFSAIPEVPFIGTIPADGMTAAAIVVRLRDANGYPVAGKTVALSTTPTGHAVISPLSGVSSNDNGAVVFTVMNSTPETLTFTATNVTDGFVLLEQPSVTFSVPPATSAGITAFPTTVTANGIAATTITVTLKDAQNLPTPGKLVTLSQGNGHSLITGPNPSVTDANGQIQFTATNLVNEVVTYTAVNVSDGNLPVPGNAVATFNNGSGTACGQNTPPPVGLNGYTLTPFATGFATGPLSYGNINFGFCAGVHTPAFLDGSVYVPNFLNGDVFQLGPDGGVVSNANKLMTLGPTLFWPVVGKDERLYALRVATNPSPPNFTDGVIYELDPDTGTVLRTVAANLPCPHGLVVDPLSGDLFFDNWCIGAGVDARIFRVRNPGSATPMVETYTTLPFITNGQMVFSPKGTLYVVSKYDQLSPPVFRVSGTDVPGPPTVTQLPGVASNYWLNIAEVGPDGEATTLITLQNGKLQLADITTNPAIITAELTNGIGGGIIGPDGCLYMPNENVLYKLTDPSSGCNFLPTNAAPALTLTPAAVSPDPAQGTVQTFIATFRNLNVPAGTPVNLNVIGPNLQVRLGRTDATGQTSISYTGVLTGKDLIFASATVNGRDLTSNLAQVTWAEGKHATFITLNPSPRTGTPGVPVSVIASLTDSSVDPTAPVVGETVSFALGSSQCFGTTNAQGIAPCQLVPSVVGTGTLTATFAGSSLFVESQTSVGFNVIAAAPACVPTTEICDGQDNDCDDQVDEGLGTVSCGVGACKRTVNACENGTPRICTPGEPTVEVCGDGVDQNCDGQDAICSPPPTAVCPLSHGYWKNHASAWPVTSLQLGAQTYSKTELLNFLGKPSRGDASLILAHQLIAAKLNIAAGVDSQPVAATSADADQRLSAFAGKLPYKVKPSSTAGTVMVADADKLADFNEGELTPHCEE
ncbi:MAG: protease pro-enzyme activation domain-containing protein [Candidatus Binatia bacterium]